MFGGLFNIFGISISVIYPLLETYKLLRVNDTNVLTSPTSFLNATINATSGMDISNKEANERKKELIYKWLTYWVVLATLFKVQSFSIVSLVINMLPFSSLITLYFQIWLVFPIVQHGEEGRPKVNGSFIIYNLYMVPYIYILDEYIQRFNFKQVVRSILNFYNTKVEGTPLPKIPMSYFYASSIELEKEIGQQIANKTVFEFAHDTWSKFYHRAAQPTPNNDQSYNNFVPTQSKPFVLDGSVTDYLPRVLLKSLVSPILAVVNRDSKPDNDYTMIGQEDVADETLDVSKARSSSTRSGDVTADASMNESISSRRSSFSKRKSSWGFGKSRTNSVNNE